MSMFLDQKFRMSEWMPTGLPWPRRWKSGEYQRLLLISGVVFLVLSVFFALFINFVRSLSSSFLPGYVFRRRRSAIIARPLDRFQTTIRRNISIHCFSHFSVTFIDINPHIHHGLTFLSFLSLFFSCQLAFSWQINGHQCFSQDLLYTFAAEIGSALPSNCFWS